MFIQPSSEPPGSSKKSWCAAHPNGVHWGLGQGSGLSSSITPYLNGNKFLAQGYRHDEIVLSPFIPLKRNLNNTVYIDILDNCVLPSLW